MVLLALVLVGAGLAVEIYDITGGATSILIGVIPYLLVLPVVAMAFPAIVRRRERWYEILLPLVPILFGIIMAITDPNRHWPQPPTFSCAPQQGYGQQHQPVFPLTIGFVQAGSTITLTQVLQ